MRRTHKMRLLLFPLLLSSVLAGASKSSKRGLIYIFDSDHASDVDLFINSSTDLTWYYNYGPNATANLSNSSLEFIPMLFGTSADHSPSTFLSTIKSQLAAGANITHVLSYNEPDGETSTGGSAVSPSDAASTWHSQLEPLRDLGIAVGAPAVTGSPRGMQWLSDFFDACKGKCTADFMAVHWYGDFAGLASHVGEVAAAYPGMEMWVTEFAEQDVNLTASQAFFNQSEALLDRWR